MTAHPSYLIGIDLGTSNSALAYAPIDQDQGAQIFWSRRLSDAARRSTRPVLPSALYAPLAGELAQSTDWVVGDFALTRAHESQGRAVISHKSWLCHPRIDRRAPVLPIDGDEASPRLSPVEAATRVLRHLTQDFAEQHPEVVWSEQPIVLTVPASFDPVARQLTVEAAERAQLSVRLLEEPQAAFYDYLDREGSGELERLLKERSRTLTLLVIDVGGGTTDLSLLRARRDSDRQLTIDRIAVGKHLLLGGDNMDLALAHRVEQRLVASGQHLDPGSFSRLLGGCRLGRERLLSDRSATSFPLSIALPGSTLVGRVARAELLQSDIDELVLDGFFPFLEHTTPPARPRSALIGFGLPYESDPAITRHVDAFLARHLEADTMLDGVLVNGGIFAAPCLIERLLQAIPRLAESQVTLLAQPHPDLAVARGAVVYARSLLGRGPRIGGGSAHGYYVALERQEGRSLVCVVPRGTREEELTRAANLPLALRVGGMVRFELYATERGALHAPGQLVELDPDFELLPPITAEFEAKGDTRDQVPVVLEGRLSAVGTLELSCVTLDRSQRFNLVFELRQATGPSQSPQSSKSESQSSAALGCLAEVDTTLDRVFGRARSDVLSREAKDLVRSLERLLGARTSWSLSNLRRIADFVAPKHKARQRSPEHERAYYMLVGFCLRPGFGHPLDRTRTEHLHGVLLSPPNHPSQIRNWQQLFIATRRIAPGLSEPFQSQFFERYMRVFAPLTERGRRPLSPTPMAEPELLDCLCALERAPTELRTKLGEWLLDRSFARPDPSLWSALARLGARAPLFGHVDRVISVRVVESWLSHLLREHWEEWPTAAESMCRLARLTGDRTRDIASPMRHEIITRLTALGAPQRFVTPLTELVELDEIDRTEALGEELPVGLTWVVSDA